VGFFACNHGLFTRQAEFNGVLFSQGCLRADAVRRLPASKDFGSINGCLATPRMQSSGDPVRFEPSSAVRFGEKRASLLAIGHLMRENRLQCA
jgi:hypothetical protein